MQILLDAVITTKLRHRFEWLVNVNSIDRIENQILRACLIPRVTLFAIHGTQTATFGLKNFVKCMMYE
jgi:hypothetical protein